MNGISKNSKKKKSLTDQIDARLGAFERKYPDVVDPNHKREETDQQKEIRFKKLRDSRKEEMKYREPRHYWWDCRRDEVHCYYFPRDYPTQEEIDWYKHVLDLQRKGEFEGFIYNSTSDAIIEWITDDAYLQMDKEAFPNHKHGAWDFFHDQLFEQEYYKEDMKPENKDKFLQGSPTAYPLKNKREQEEEQQRLQEQ